MALVLEDFLFCRPRGVFQPFFDRSIASIEVQLQLKPAQASFVEVAFSRSR